MSISTKGMHLVCVCEDEVKIGGIMGAITNLLKNSDHITKYELHEILDWYAANEDKNIGWTADACDHAVLKIAEDGYELYLPQPDWHQDPEENADTGAEPIDVTIGRDEVHNNPDLVERVIRVVFEISDKIKDRPIFINII